jgi:arylsulfatase A
MRDITGQPTEDRGGEDSFSLVPTFKGEDQTGRETLIRHFIGGSFAIRQSNWKLCLSAGSGGWSAPGNPVPNDREVTFLPKGVSPPVREQLRPVVISF